MYPQRTSPDPASEPAYRSLSETLRTSILDGTYRPGERLPTEHELSTRSGLGRSTIREAIRTLESQGLVVTTRGVKGGTFVAAPDTDTAARTLGTQLDFLTASDQLTVDDLIEAREAIELPATELAARRTSGNPLTAIIPSHREGDHLRHNWRFHSTVIRLSGNPLFELLAAPILTILESRFDRSRMPLADWLAIDEDHRRIAGHIENGEARQARAAMHGHLETVRLTYAGLEQRSPDPAADSKREGGPA